MGIGKNWKKTMHNILVICILRKEDYEKNTRDRVYVKNACKDANRFHRPRTPQGPRVFSLSCVDLIDKKCINAVRCLSIANFDFRLKGL